MAQEIEENIEHNCSSCRALGSANYHCQECFNALALCLNCIILCHQLYPLHWIQIWTGTYFDMYALYNLGLKMHLGHGGLPCLSLLGPKEMVIIQVNGIHHCLVQFCDCNDLIPNFWQLVLSCLFPATLTSPATAFTFELLKSFHQLTLSSKITAYDYFDVFRK